MKSKSKQKKKIKTNAKKKELIKTHKNIIIIIISKQRYNIINQPNIK